MKIPLAKMMDATTVCNTGTSGTAEKKRKAKENGLKYPILIAPLFAQLICSALLCGGGCCGAAYVILPMDGGMGFCRMVGGRCRKKVKSNARFNCPNADGE